MFRIFWEIFKFTEKCFSINQITWHVFRVSELLLCQSSDKKNFVVSKFSLLCNLYCVSEKKLSIQINTFHVLSCKVYNFCWQMTKIWLQRKTDIVFSLWRNVWSIRFVMWCVLRGLLINFCRVYNQIFVIL